MTFQLMETKDGELPLFKCHKTVRAAKIEKVELTRKNKKTVGAKLHLHHGLLPILVDAEYVEKHKPETGGYFVTYKDGYQSFSPAEAFEDGYTEITDSDSAQINAIYDIVHEYQQDINDKSLLPWGKIDTIYGVEHSFVQCYNFLRDDPEASPSTIHSKWTDIMTKDGWTHAPIFNFEEKKHPLLVDYSFLPQSVINVYYILIACFKSMNRL